MKMMKNRNNQNTTKRGRKRWRTDRSRKRKKGLSYMCNTCCESSFVGATMRALKPASCGFASSDMMGIPNASVLPEPAHVRSRDIDKVREKDREMDRDERR